MASAAFLDILRGSAPYIHAHHGATFVVAFGGESAARTDFKQLIYDVALLHSLGVKLVLVHGARPQIDARLQAAGMQGQFVQGHRITDDAALDCVKAAVGSLRLEIEALLSTSLASTPMGGAKLDVAGGNLVIAKPVGVRDGTDYRHTGEVRRIDVEALRALLDRGSVVLLSPVGYSPTGDIFNLRYEDVATATATALGADKLLLLHEGERLSARLPNSPAQLDLPQARSLLARADLHIAPLLQAAVQACEQGVTRAHLVSHAEDGALLQELYSHDGAGTLVTAEAYDYLRTAELEDIGGLLALIEPLEQAGVLVPRGRERIELELDHFLVMARDGLITACCALLPYHDEKIGEIACVAVHPQYRKQGRANALLLEAEKRARTLGLKRLCALTTHAPHWFIERGFVESTPEALPIPRQRLYNVQRNSKVFLKTL